MITFNIIEHDEIASEYIVNVVDDDLNFNAFCHPYKDISFIKRKEGLKFFCMFTNFLKIQRDLNKDLIEINGLFDHTINGKLLKPNLIKIRHFEFELDIELEEKYLNKYVTIGCDRIDLLSVDDNS